MHNNADMRLLEFQSSAKRHMGSLSLEELDRFSRAARNHLDGLPTTHQQDQAILVVKREHLAQVLLVVPPVPTRGMEEDEAIPSSTTVIDLEDVIRAIEYRGTFKMALVSALNSSEASAQTIRETEYSRHGDL
jgi:hypothetical protein